MKFVEITLKQGLFEKNVSFSEFSNIVYSKNNSTGKTTFLRAIFYALGYPIPSTKGLSFEKMEFWLTVKNKNKIYKLYRHKSLLTVDYEDAQIDYSLPTDFHEIISLITECENDDIIDNLLGAFYMDQEKGWTLLNRGKVIGNIPFKIESLVRGLDGKECNKELSQLEAIETELKKYKYMDSVADYQDEVYEELDNSIDFENQDNTLELKIEIIRSKKEQLIIELNQIKNVLRKNKTFIDYITNMNLLVMSSTGEEIPVTKDTLVGFNDNNEILSIRREMLSLELDKLNRQIDNLEKKKEEDEQLFKVQSVIEEFESKIKNIHIDRSVTKNVIRQLNRERQEIKDRITMLTKRNNTVVEKLYYDILFYTKELGVDDKYIDPTKDFIFTNDLKSLSGTILHKIVLAFKLAYIKQIREKAEIILPIVLDSPTGREVKKETTEAMLKLIQRDFKDHQLIIASIYDFKLQNKKIIEFKQSLFDQ